MAIHAGFHRPCDTGVTHKNVLGTQKILGTNILCIWYVYLVRLCIKYVVALNDVIMY